MINPKMAGLLGLAGLGVYGSSSGKLGNAIQSIGKQKKVSDISKYEQGKSVERKDIATGLDKYTTRKESDYTKKITREEPWNYDMSINLDAKAPHKEAEDYLMKNIPFVTRALDNTEYLSELAYGITSSYGLKAFKTAVDDVIHKLNPMNFYDEEGNEIHIGKGFRYGAGDIDLAIMKHFDYDMVFSKDNKAGLRKYWEQKYSTQNSQREKSRAALDDMFSQPQAEESGFGPRPDTYDEIERIGRH